MHTLTLIRAAIVARDRYRHYDRLAATLAWAGDEWIHEMIEARDKAHKYASIERRLTEKYTQQIERAGI